MSPLEFSNEFEVLYNNIMSNQAPGINEYEKSIFLTKAQLEKVKNVFNAGGNRYQEGYDDSAKRQYDFSTLNVTKKYIVNEYNELSFAPIWNNMESIITHNENNIFNDSVMDTKFNRYHYPMPEDFLFFINEEAFLERVVGLPDMTLRNAAIVTPISYDDYTVARGGVYKYPPKGECWKLITNRNGVVDNEIIAPYNTKIYAYTVRYVRKPRPIILTNILEEYGTTIDGIGTITECELPEAMHSEIVQRAVELAKAAYRTGETEVITQMGQRSE